MPRKAKTTEEFQRELDDKYPNKYTLTTPYITAKKKIGVRYNDCGHENIVIPNNLKGGTGCPICHNLHRVKHEDFIQRLSRKHPNVYDVVDKYVDFDTPLEVIMKSCGHHVMLSPKQMFHGINCPMCKKPPIVSQEDFLNTFWQKYSYDYEPIDSYINRHQSAMRILHKPCGTIFTRSIGTIIYNDRCVCPVCYNTNNGGAIDIGVNDIMTKRPDVAELLLDKNDAYKYGAFSANKTSFVCPYCGSIVLKRIVDVCRHGFHCSQCGASTSFGERFVSCLFDYLNIKYISQYSPNWIGTYRYDFKFEFNNKKYIVEVDGAFHQEDNQISGQTASEVRERDVYKEHMAIEHGYVVVRLDYNYGSKDKIDCIINSIQNSELMNVLDLYNVDFLLIAKQAEVPLVKQVADLWNSYQEKSIYQLCIDTGKQNGVIRPALYTASKLGLIKETKEEIIELNRLHGYKMLNNTPRRILCNETGEIFNSISSADKKYHANITSYFKEGRKSSGKLPDGTRLTWTELKD